MPVFDEQYVDCNTCEHYHNNTCDAVPVGSERTCTAFKATRKVNIPEEIKSLREQIRGLRKEILLIYLLMFLEALAYVVDMILG